MCLTCHLLVFNVYSILFMMGLSFFSAFELMIYSQGNKKKHDSHTIQKSNSIRSTRRLRKAKPNHTHNQFICCKKRGNKKSNHPKWTWSVQVKFREWEKNFFFLNSHNTKSVCRNGDIVLFLVRIKRNLHKMHEKKLGHRQIDIRVIAYYDLSKVSE